MSLNQKMEEEIEDEENINEIIVDRITEINKRLIELDNILSTIRIDYNYDIYVKDKRLSSHTVNILNTITKKYNINNLNKIINIMNIYKIYSIKI